MTPTDMHIHAIQQSHDAYSPGQSERCSALTAKNHTSILLLTAKVWSLPFDFIAVACPPGVGTHMLTDSIEERQQTSPTPLNDKHL